jgi:nucleotide-binding universal stress UspA family protein
VKPETIIVPLDGTEQALAALPVARTLADTLAATLNVVHVGERALPSRAILGELGLDAEDVKGFVIEQRTGNPAEEVLRFAAGRREPLLVLCTHTDAEKPRGTLGGVAEHVLVHARCGVVLVEPDRGRRPWSLRRILLPHDGTPTTAAAMDPAGDLAELTGAEVLVLHVAAPGAPPPVEPGTLTAPRYLDQPQHEWPAWAAEFLGRMCALGHPPSEVRFGLVMATGEPGEEIVRVAREYESDLVVLAWHGVWEAEHALTMKEVIRNAPCPELVVRAGREGGPG